MLNNNTHTCRAVSVHATTTIAVVAVSPLLLLSSLLLQGASLHALWRLEVDLLKRFEVPSFQGLQVPGGCVTLLSALAAHDDLAAALTGWSDTWDCGAVTQQEVLRVVQQVLRNIRHSARSRGRAASEGSKGRRRGERVQQLGPAAADLCLQLCSLWTAPELAVCCEHPGLACSCCRASCICACRLPGCCWTTGAVATAVASVLCTHFQVSDVSQLGYGSVQCLLREVEEEGGGTAASATDTHRLLQLLVLLVFRLQGCQGQQQLLRLMLGRPAGRLWL